MDLQKQSEKSLTQEIGLLPPTGEIAKQIENDAIKLADDIKNKLIAEASKSKDGRVVVEHTVPVLYQDRVVNSLQAWAKMQSWKLGYHQGSFSLIPKGVRFEGRNMKLCKNCANVKLEFRENFFLWSGIVGSITSAATIILAAVYAGSAWWLIAPAMIIGILGGSIGHAIGLHESRGGRY